MIIEYYDQLSPDWFKARGAIPTASCFDRIITTTGKASTQRKKYLYQLAGETLLGRKEETYQSAAMTRGIELEPEARETYEFITDTQVEQVGLIYKDERKRCACSPDGLIPGGGLELKCPSVSIHMEYLHKGKMPSTYYQQVMGSLYITGLEYWDFMSYYPKIKPFIIRVYPDKKWMEAFENEINKFCNELEKLIKELKNAI